MASVQETYDLAARFRPQYLFTLDQIAYILQIPEQRIGEYVHLPDSRMPVKNKMQAVTYRSIYGDTQVRVPESQLNEWATRTKYRAIALHM